MKRYRFLAPFFLMFSVVYILASLGVWGEKGSDSAILYTLAVIFSVATILLGIGPDTLKAAAKRLAVWAVDRGLIHNYVDREINKGISLIGADKTPDLK